MRQYKGDIMLLTAAAVGGTGFVFLKYLLEMGYRGTISLKDVSVIQHIYSLFKKKKGVQNTKEHVLRTTPVLSIIF